MNNFFHKHYQSETGFSLIELLVVMLIIAVLAAGASLVVNPQGSTAKQLNKAGEQLFQQMSYARDEALVLNTAVGLDIQQSEDDFELSREMIWKKLDGFDELGNPRFTKMTDPLTGYELSEKFRWGIIVDEEVLAANLNQLLSSGEEEGNPEILFESSGEVTSFSLTIFLPESYLQNNPEARDYRYLITLNERGELTRYRVGEVEE